MPHHAASSSAHGLDLELSRSYDELVDGARVHPTRMGDEASRLSIDVSQSDSETESRHAFVHFESPRALEETAARVAALVRSQSTTRSSTPSPRSPVLKRPGMQQFRSQRLLSMASDKTNGSNPSTTSHENGSESPHSHSHGKRRVPNAAVLNCPSSHYYIDCQGRLQVRRAWWLYTKVRRLLAHVLPGIKGDDNTFLCAPMISNTLLTIVIYVLRLVINDAILKALLDREQQKECHEFSSEFLDIFSFSLLGNVLLCVPALNMSWCKLYKRIKPLSKRKLDRVPVNGTLGIDPLGGVDAAGAPLVTAAAADGAVVHDDDHPKLKKTYLFTLCELLVIIEIPYLVYIFVTVFFPTAVIADSRGTHTDVWSVSTRCASELSIGIYLTFIIAQVIGLMAYVLRWNQIILFHRMHEHFLYQRGCVPGRARFDYVEQSFRILFFAPRRLKQIHDIKKKLYHAAKYGEIDEVRAQIEAAMALDGPDFAHKWYENTGFLSNVFGKRFVKCQRNPLHVAVAFDNAEVVQELLSNAMFDVHQVEKMELLKLNVSWVYRFFFDIVPMLRMSNYSKHQTRLVFGPVGLFCSTLLTPLHVAVSMGNTDMVLLLLRYGADPNLSAQSSHRKFATPPLFWAINKECARLLLDADANPLHVPGNGYFLTAFEVARLVGNHAVAMEIEKYGGDVALTPLHDASARGYKKEVRFYLEHGASPDTLGEKVTGFFRRTPLHWAAIRGEAKVIKLLLKFGAEVDATDAFGRTALAWACLLNRIKAVEVLLQYGADVNVRDIQGDPLLCICAAGTCSSPSTAAFSSDAHNGGQHDHHRRHAAHNDHGGPNGHSTDFTTSQTARTLDPAIFALLQNHGIDLHATREGNGDTALHVALRKNNEATAILFVRAGMNLTAVNYMGQRAMDCTTSSSLRYAIKKEAGHRDVMISYCHSHSALARKVRDALEAAYITTWIDSMDPSGITGGSVWRQEIANGIRSSALVLALLTIDYPMSQWCMKELAFAKMHNVPIVAIQCEDMQMTEELQVYLWTRQIVDFRPAFVERVVETTDVSPADKSSMSKEKSSHAGSPNVDGDEALLAQQDPRDVAEDTDGGQVAKPKLIVKLGCDDEMFRNCMRLLLDGIHDQIEEHRVKRFQRQQRQKMLMRARSGINDAPAMSSEDEDDEDEDSDAILSDHGQRHSRGSNVIDRSDLLLDEPSIGVAPAPPKSYVFIAHGDYHLPFCQRLQKSLQKQGLRCVLDQAAPSILYGSGFCGVPGSGSHGSPRLLRRQHSAATNHSAGYGSGGETATATAQARQLAAKDAILDCTAVIVVLSPISAKCDMLADQLAFAEDRGKLIVPLMLSLHTIDLAKRYTFSRSVVQHFNVSIGFDQSMERLVMYLQQAMEAIQRQEQLKKAEVQQQIRAARRQRRKERERARRHRLREGGNMDTPSLVGSDGDDSDGASSSPGSSPASSLRSGLSRVSGAHAFSPSSFSVTSSMLDGALPPTIPILQPSRQPATGVTSGHGWSVGTPSPPRESASSDHHRHEFADTPESRREPPHHFGTERLLHRTSSSLSSHRSDRPSGGGGPAFV